LVDVETAPGEIKPKLATRWQISRDGLTYTFTLRPGVRFHDGTPMDAAAVKFTIDRLLDPRVRNPNRHLYAAIKSWNVRGPPSGSLSQPSRSC
jgi:peptide/nickel transport system substrate-binding protein